jgi:predicted dehydrogenase
MRLRVGVIGCGMVAQIMHLPYLSSLRDRFAIAALSDLSPGLLRTMGDRYGVPETRRFADYRDLIATDVDAVLVLTAGSHAPPVLDALEAGKHVLVEKPLCITLREADEIATAARRSGTKLMVAYMKRYDPGFRYAQRVIGGMEGVRYVQVNTLHPAEDQYRDIHGLARFDDVSPDVAQRLRREYEELLDEAVGDIGDALRFVYYDVLLGSMVHDVNALRALLGEPEDVLFTELWPENDMAPSVTTVLRHPGDVRTVYTWTYLAELRDYLEEIAVMSSASRVRIQFPSPFLKHFPTPVVVQRMENGVMVETRAQVSYDEAFQEELRAFHACVVDDTPPLTDVDDARADIAVLQRILAVSRPRGLGGEAGRHVLQEIRRS